MRQTTYAPGFAYLDRQTVRGAMWELAQQTTALNELLRPEEAPDEAARAEILERLTAMEGIVARIDTEGQATNHPMIAGSIGALRRDVAAARRGAAAEPPDYFLAGSVAGACLYCHR